MIPLKGALWTLGAVVGVFLLFAGYRAYQSAQDAKIAVWKAHAEAAHDTVLVLSKLSAKRDTEYVRGKDVYLKGRDRVLHDTVPVTPAVRACYESADRLISACELRHSADSSLIAAKDRELSVWKAKPSGETRLQAYGEAQYDFIHLVPVARVGVTARVFGPVYLSAAGDVSIEKHPTARALAGLRINF